MDSQLLDSINIKTYPELIVNFLKDNNINSNFNNLRGFYNELLASLSEDIRDSYLNRILKYLSAKEESNIYILDDIGNGIYENELKNFFNKVHDEINKSKNSLLFYKKLCGLCSFIYFNNNESDSIKNEFDKSNYSAMLYKLFVHAAINYKTNTPKILAERLLQEALCLAKTNATRGIILKMAADLGNDLACHLYATVIYDDYIERCVYYLKGKNMACNLWELAFIIEHYELNKDQYDIIIRELKDILKNIRNVFEDKIIVLDAKNEFESNCTLLAFELNLYLSHIRKFSKAYCSIGKYFFIHKIAVVNDDGTVNEEKSIEYALNYSYKAVRLGNIAAMENIATYYYKHKEKGNFDYREFFKIGADAKFIISSEHLTKILMEENNMDDAEMYLKFIANYNKSDAQYKLAKLYENKLRFDDAIEYYEKAINNNLYSASIDLAKLYFKKYMMQVSKDNSKNGYLLLAVNLINSYYDKYNDEEKKEADYLLKTFKDLL